MGVVNSFYVAWLLILAAGANSCIGNLMLKQSRRVAEQDQGLLGFLFSPWLLGGLMFYAINVVLFAKGLDRLPVSVAYPALAGSGFAMLTLAAAWLFDERLATSQYLGLLLVLAGILLLARS